MTEVSFRVVKEFEVVRVKLTKEIQDRVQRLSAERKCLACQRDLVAGEKVTCGCCVQCYQIQSYAMRKGFVTLRSLIASGERKAAGVGGRKPASAYGMKLLGNK
jgi:hypothetical protein